MGCSGCAAAAAIAAANRRPAIKITPEQLVEINANCEFSQSMLQNFKSKLVWYKDSGKYFSKGITPAVLNRYIGLVLTSINIKNKCTYRLELFQIQDLVSIITLEQNV